MPTPRKVMISSTVHDLARHRQQVAVACVELGMLPLMMEHLPACSLDAVTLSEALVDQADVFVGLAAVRYGHIAPGHGISYQEIEYNRAVQRGLPRLIFLADPDHPPFSDEVVEKGDGAEKLRAFINRLKHEVFVRRFKSPEDLRGHAVSSLLSYGLSTSDYATGGTSALTLFRSGASSVASSGPADPLGGHRKVVFSGSDTYELALFVREVVAEGGADAIITATGADNHAPTESDDQEFTGIPLTGAVDGYCRTVVICTDEGTRVDVGGSNATLERVRSRQTRCLMSASLFETIASRLPWLWVHKQDIPRERLVRHLESFVDTERIDVIASLGQRLRDEPSARLLFELLQKRHPPEYTLMLAQSFRAFAELCRSDQECAMTLTLGLGDFIREAVRWEGQSQAVVYAIESLASVSQHHPSTRQVAGHGLVQFLRKESNLLSHADLPWAALVALEQIRPIDPATLTALTGIVRSLTRVTRGYTFIVDSLEKLAKGDASHN